MIRIALVVLLLIHGMAHLAGGGVSRFMLAGGFGAVAVGVMLREPWWLVALEVLVCASVIFCLANWPKAQFGLVANLFVIAVGFAVIRFGGELALRNHDLEKLWGTGSENRVLLKMHGEIKLGQWFPFQAEEVLAADGNFVWAATVSAYGIPIRGSDRLIQGQGVMSWKLLDVFPVMSATGPDITKSALGRATAEIATWLVPAGTPSAVPGRVTFPRWGNPGGGAFRDALFVVEVEEVRSFGGRVVPSRIRAGWDGDEFFRATIDSADYR